MQNFMRQHGVKAEAVATAFITTQRFGSRAEIKKEVARFCTVCAFLFDSPAALSWRGKVKPSLTTNSGLEAVAKKFFAARYKTDYPAPPQTQPDEVVSLVMQIVYRYTKRQTDAIKLEHQHSMSAENIVGALLERYIASVMEKYDWVWCAGDFVKAADFLQYKSNEWVVLQVKNRDNTENSSSSAIRKGTQIQKWFRTFSKTGETNWDAFPDEEFRSKLTEKGFQAYVENYLNKANVV